GSGHAFAWTSQYKQSPMPGPSFPCGGSSRAGRQPSRQAAAGFGWGVYGGLGPPAPAVPFPYLPSDLMRPPWNVIIQWLRVEKVTRRLSARQAAVFSVQDGRPPPPDTNALWSASAPFVIKYALAALARSSPISTLRRWSAGPSVCPSTRSLREPSLRSHSAGPSSPFFWPARPSSVP